MIYIAPLNEEQLNQKKTERKEQIMRAALKVFADNGVKLTKISMIAKEAGVSHGLVYHYFTSKEEVLYESLKWGVALNETRNFLQQLDEKSISPLGKIKEFTKYAFSASSSSITTNIFRIIQNMERSEGIPKDVKDFMDNLGLMYIEYFIPIIKEGQESGEIYQDDPEELVGIFLTIVSGVMADDIDFWQENMDRKVDVFLRMLSTH